MKKTQQFYMMKVICVGIIYSTNHNSINLSEQIYKNIFDLHVYGIMMSLLVFHTPPFCVFAFNTHTHKQIQKYNI